MATETLVDTNVLLDVVTNDVTWLDWSVARLRASASTGRLVIVDVVYAELSVGFTNQDMIDDFLKDFDLRIVSMSRDALFAAGKAYRDYRAAGGPRMGVLPDFFIGAYAAAADIPLLTRDPRRYRVYFPDVVLIAP